MVCLSLLSSWPVDIRLVGGAKKNEGRVEVKYNGTWGSICADHWGLNDAMVVCEQLGYSKVLPYLGTLSDLDQQKVENVLSGDLGCLIGTVSDIAHCNYTSPWGSHTCYSGLASVKCSGGEHELCCQHC